MTPEERRALLGDDLIQQARALAASAPRIDRDSDKFRRIAALFYPARVKRAERAKRAERRGAA